MVTGSLPQMEKERGIQRTKNANMIHVDDIYAYTNLDYTKSLYTKLSSLG